MIIFAKQHGLTRRKLLAVVGVLAVVAFGIQAAAQSLSGNYRVEGRNPDGSAYFGVVTLVDHGSEVTVAWEVGSSSYAGRGIKEGRILTVDWGAASPVIYVRDVATGALYGTWDRGRASERLLPN